MKITSKLMFAAVVLLASCQKENLNKQSAVNAKSDVSEAMIRENGNNPDENLLSTENKSGHVYIESNDANENAIVMYNQGWDGKLSWGSSTASGGKGTGAGLGSQSAITINKEHTWLFAVNAGSNSVSSFKIKNDGSLELKSTENSGGTLPVSVCVHNDLLYVVNSKSANISGYKIGWNGSLTWIKGSQKDLSDITALPAQISFSPEGNSLLVTEKTTSVISSFSLNANGAVTNAVYTNSVGEEPFGFDFARGKYMIVTNAFQGADNKSSCTSYTNLYLNISDVNGSVANHQSASCWIAAAKYGRYAFVTDTKSNNIVSYYINSFGAIYYIPWSVVSTGLTPIDITVSANNLYVYNINAGDHTITEFKRGVLGTLKSIGTVSSLPTFAAGIIAE